MGRSPNFTRTCSRVVPTELPWLGAVGHHQPNTPEHRGHCSHTWQVQYTLTRHSWEKVPQHPPLQRVTPSWYWGLPERPHSSTKPPRSAPGAVGRCEHTHNTCQPGLHPPRPPRSLADRWERDGCSSATKPRCWGLWLPGRAPPAIHLGLHVVQDISQRVLHHGPPAHVTHLQREAQLAPLLDKEGPSQGCFPPQTVVAGGKFQALP